MSNLPSYDDYLAHYGVKGMKWGRRKKRSESNDSEGAVSEGGSSEVATSDKQRKILNKKNLAIGAAVVGSVAAVGVGAAIASNRHAEGKKAALRSKIAEQSKMNIFEMYLNNPPPPPKTKSKYKDRHKRADTKRYGERGAARVEKLVNKGYSLRDARTKEFSRKLRRDVARTAFNIAFTRG